MIVKPMKLALRSGTSPATVAARIGNGMTARGDAGKPTSGRAVYAARGAQPGR
jgi:hypothetical protein